MSTRTFNDIIYLIRKIFNKPDGIIPLHEPVFSGNEKRYLLDCVDSTFVSSVGEFVDRFELLVAAYTKSKYAVATVNGTSALHISLQLAGVNPGDEVITQPLTFIATANAISYCQAYPVFVDVEADSMGLSPEKLIDFLNRFTIYDSIAKKYINKQSSRPISAIVPMHTFGNPCRIDEIVEIAERFNIPVVEDAAESLGSRYKSKHTGTFGQIGVLSFNGNKIITTGGGGMIITDNLEIATKAKYLTTQAKAPHPWEFVHNVVGYNYRMPNINAALGVAQIEKLDEFIANKRKTADIYHNYFDACDIRYNQEIVQSFSNYWLNAILLSSREERDSFLKLTNHEGIKTRPVWTLMNKLPMYSECQTFELFHAVDLENRVVNLPSSFVRNRES